jgi:hypothetical protein
MSPVTSSVVITSAVAAPACDALDLDRHAAFWLPFLLPFTEFARVFGTSNHGHSGMQPKEESAAAKQAQRRQA